MIGGYRFSGGTIISRPKSVPTYFQKIPFVETLEGESNLDIIIKEGSSEKKYSFTKGAEFSFYDFNDAVEFTAPVVFAAYGIRNEELKIDDLKGIDVKGKVVLCFSGLPYAMRDTASAFYKKHNLKDWRETNKIYEEKEDLLRKLGAAAIIYLPGYSQSNTVSNPFRYNSATFEGEKRLRSNTINLSLPADSLNSSIPRISASPKIIKELFDGTGIDINAIMKNTDKNYKSASKEIKGKFIHFKNSAKTKTTTGRNVLGMIEGENPNEVIVIGAHYDHLGMYNGFVWNGADDNASGTVGVMTIAKAMIETGIKPRKTIIFAAWTGEEKGLYGSVYFVDKYKKKENLVLNLNFDMISRKPDNDSTGFKAGMDYTQAYPILKDLVEKINKEYDLGLTVDFRPAKRPQGGTDFTPFAAKDIPVFGFDAAFTKDYHQYTDHVEKADFDLMTKIIKAGFGVIYEIASSDKKIEPAK